MQRSNSDRKIPHVPFVLVWSIIFSSLVFQIPVKKVITHEKYKEEGGLTFNKLSPKWGEANDIALIRLEKPAKLGANIIPACLPFIDEVSWNN